MAGAIARLYATLGLDAREFDQGLTKSERTLRNFGSGIVGGLGFGAGLGTLNAVRQATEFVVQGFQDVTLAASNMTETQTKLDQTFLTSADSMRAWAADSAQSMIMSEQAALESASTFGNFLQALDIG